MQLLVTAVSTVPSLDYLVFVAICHLVWHYELLGLSVYRSVYGVVGFQPHPYNVYCAII
jgi:hypothetical protein